VLCFAYESAQTKIEFLFSVFNSYIFEPKEIDPNFILMTDRGVYICNINGQSSHNFTKFSFFNNTVDTKSVPLLLKSYVQVLTRMSMLHVRIKLMINIVSLNCLENIS
jgi:hypothetical protein